jgi:hypothetical protein
MFYWCCFGILAFYFYASFGLFSLTGMAVLEFQNAKATPVKHKDRISECQNNTSET